MTKIFGKKCTFNLYLWKQTSEIQSFLETNKFKFDVLIIITMWYKILLSYFYITLDLCTNKQTINKLSCYNLSITDHIKESLWQKALIKDRHYYHFLDHFLIFKKMYIVIKILYVTKNWLTLIFIFAVRWESFYLLLTTTCDITPF